MGTIIIDIAKDTAFNFFSVYIYIFVLFVWVEFDDDCILVMFIYLLIFVSLILSIHWFVMNKDLYICEPMESQIKRNQISKWKVNERG